MEDRKEGDIASLVLPFINTMMFADGVCEARSRQEEEVDAWPSSTTTNAEIVRNPHLPYGWPIPLSLLLHYRKTWRRRFANSIRRARHKHHRIYEREHLARGEFDQGAGPEAGGSSSLG